MTESHNKDDELAHLTSLFVCLMLYTKRPFALYCLMSDFKENPLGAVACFKLLEQEFDELSDEEKNKLLSKLSLLDKYVRSLYSLSGEVIAASEIVGEAIFFNKEFSAIKDRVGEHEFIMRQVYNEVKQYKKDNSKDAFNDLPQRLIGQILMKLKPHFVKGSLKKIVNQEDIGGLVAC